jgi:hypothetical protein
MDQAPAGAASLYHGWKKGPNVRGTLDILWTCIITMFLGSWSALFLNLPEEKSGKSRYFLNKGRWMIVILLFPEMITGIAAEQWRSARQSMEDFKSLETKWAALNEDRPRTLLNDEMAKIRSNLSSIKASPWSMRHAFFADMGGVLLHCPDFPPFPINAYQLNNLIAKGHVAYPEISQKEIWDKNKADGFARLVTLLQIIWFTVQCIGRAVQHLTITTLELSTLSFIFCTVNTLYFWNHKPLDVETPIRLECATSLRNILADYGKNLNDGYSLSPLEFIDPPISRTSLIAPFWVGFEVTFGKHHKRTEAILERVPNTRTIPPRGLIKRDMLFALIFVFGYFGIYLAAWRFIFPTRHEQILWRVSTFIQLGLSGVYFLAVLASSLDSLVKPFAKRILKTTEFQNPIELAYKLPHWLAVLIHIPFFLVYIVARTYMIVEGFCNLRALSKSAYSTVEWESFMPHFS